MESYLPAITTVLGALIALAGVRLSARADDRRARDARLWDRRAELYVDALRFLQDLDRLRAEDLAEPAFTARMNDLDARMGAFGDDDTVAAFKRARLPEYDGTFSPPDWFERVVRERLTQQRALPQGLVLKALKYRLTQKRIVIPTTYSSTRHNPSYLEGGTGYGADLYNPSDWLKGEPEDSTAKMNLSGSRAEERDG